MSAAGSTASRGFLLACVLAAVAIALGCAWVASLEWFSRDDFAFLARVQRVDPWSWRAVFLPLDERFWSFYRPLGMETYFYLGFQLFGLEASGYFAISLAFHFASGALVYRIGRQLGFDLRVALVTALLAVSRQPTLGQIFYGSVFHFVISVFFTSLSITCFLEYAARGGRRWQVASCVALGLALLCNEVNATTPALLAVAALGTRRPELRFARRVAVAVAPHLLLVALYLVFRFLLLAPVAMPTVYTPVLGPHVLRNTAIHVLFVFGGTRPLAVAALLAAALGAALFMSAPGRRERARLGRLAAMAITWTAVVLAPFALVPFPQERYAMLAVVPVCLLFGALLDAFWRIAGGSYPRALEAGLVLALLASIPFGVLAEQAANPRGDGPRRIVRAIETQGPVIASNARLVLLYGTPELAAREPAIAFRYLAYNGMVVDAVYPETTMSMRFHDLSRRSPRNVIRPLSFYFQLSPSLEVERADGALLDRELRRGIESTVW
jgi:hypothetical protein